MSLVDSIKDGPVVEKKAPPQKREKGKGKKGPAEKNIIRIGIIGFRGVGKSSLLDRFISGDEIDRSKNVVEINSSVNDTDWLTNPKKWVDYTELPESGTVQTVAENTGLLDEDELIANGYQLTDTGWVKA